MRAVFKPFDEDAEIHRRRRNLPHWIQAGCTYFVTFRTADSLPQSKLDEIRRQQEVWLQFHPEPLSDEDRMAFQDRFSEQIQTWLDAGYGECVLRQPELGNLVSTALRFFDGVRYTLDDFVVMPNHVHALVLPWANFTLVQILHSWKSYTSNQINAALGLSGVFWMDENFDHAVRSWGRLEEHRRYIRENPVKAGLPLGSCILGSGVQGIVER